MANDNPIDQEKRRLTELSALVEMRLGKRLDDRTFYQLADIQHSLQSEQQKLAELLHLGKVSPEQYLLHFNSLLTHSMHRCNILLGDGGFEAMFGDAGKQPEKLVDPDVFLNRE